MLVFTMNIPGLNIYIYIFCKTKKQLYMFNLDSTFLVLML